MAQAEFTISVVSHGHGALIGALLDDICRIRPVGADDIVVTLNIPEPADFDTGRWGARVRWIVNPAPKGFASNHNAALADATGRYLAVVNPDIRLDTDAFAALAARLSDRTGLAVPRIVDGAGVPQDAARRVPTPFALARRLLSRLLGRSLPPVSPDEADWFAGMFYVASREAWQATGGFDEGYFLYCEDVDFCLRLRLAGWEPLLAPDVVVRHDARRDSHRSLKHLSLHIRAIRRLWASETYRAYRSSARPNRSPTGPASASLRV